MLKVIINSLEMDFDGAISFKMLNPMFNDQVSHSFSVKTYNTARNKDIIEQLHLPEKRYNQVRFDALIITEAFTFRGAIYFTSVTDKYLDFQFNSQNDFWARADVSLKALDIPFDGVYVPMKNAKFCDNFPLTGEYSGYVNGLTINGVPAMDDTTLPVPSLRLNNILEGILTTLGIESRKNSLSEHADIEQLYLLSSTSNAKYKYAPWQGINGCEDYHLKFQGFYVSVGDGKYHFYNPNGHTVKDGSYVLLAHAYIRPIIVENQLLNKAFKAIVEDEYNLTIDVDPVITTLNPGEPDAYTAFFALPLYDGLIEESTKNHVPEINAGDFIKEVEKLTASCLFVDESSNEYRFLFLKDIIKSADVIDVSEFAGDIKEQIVFKKDGYKLTYEEPTDEIWENNVKQFTDLLNVKDAVASLMVIPLSGNTNNDVRLVINENMWYRFYEINFLQKSGWEKYSMNILNFKDAGGEFSIQTKFSPLLSLIDTKIIEYGQGFNYTIRVYSLLMPTIEKEGKFMLMNEYNEDDFRLFFYRGMINNRIENYVFSQLVSFEEVPMPLSTHDVYDSSGVKIPTANLSLRWDGTYGLYNQLYKEYIDLMVNQYREETRFVNWPAWMLNSFTWWKKYRINHMNYLVKSIDLDISPRGVKIKDSVLVPV